MPLSAQDAFKIGYLGRCVEDGLSPDQIAASVKTASDMLEKSGIFGEAITAAKDLLGTAAHYTIPALAFGPPLLGAGAGYGLAKATDIDDQDIADIKNQEVLDEYRHQTEKLKRRKTVQDFLKTRQQSSRLFI